jgi:hypothetical protein
MAVSLGLGLALLATGAFDVYKYFGVWAHHRAAVRAFHRDYVDIARRINALPAGRTSRCPRRR